MFCFYDDTYLSIILNNYYIDTICHNEITMTTTVNNGRLGNQIIRNLAVSLIAKKHNLKVNYCNEDLIGKLGINLFSGSKVHKSCIPLNDANYFDIHNCDNLNHNLDPNGHYFQTKEITHLLHSHLHTDAVKSHVIEKNPFKRLYTANNSLYVHVRLADAAHWNPGIDYYLNAIKTTNCDDIYISTDDKNHPIVQTLLHLPNSKLMIGCNEIRSIQFGSTCKHVVLSHGSFSAITGYISYFSTIYYPKYDSTKMWCGDMFSINGWIEC